jgi:hypothetical protein
VNEEEVTEFIIQTAKQVSTISGSCLGKAVTERFPDLRGDPEYSRLSRFIRDHCANRIVPVGSRGKDDIYKYVPEGGTASPIAKVRKQPSVWDVFQRPGAEGRLTINKLTGEVRISLQEEDSSDTFAPVASVNPEEHRAIAVDFLEKVVEASRAELQAALAQENYWSRWSKVLDRVAVHKQAWNEFRSKRLCELFGKRLRDHGLAEKVIATSMQQLVLGKKEKANRTKNGGVLSPPSGRRVTVGESKLSPADLRAVIRTAIETMSEDELRRLSLPLGDVLDALRHRQR